MPTSFLKMTYADAPFAAFHFSVAEAPPMLVAVRLVTASGSALTFATGLYLAAYWVVLPLLTYALTL